MKHVELNLLQNFVIKKIGFKNAAERNRVSDDGANFETICI